VRQAAAQSVAPVAVARDLPLKLIGAELALQKNDLAAAAQGYADAAALSPDPVIAEQATRLALAVKQWPLARTALQRWQELAPKAPGVVQARAWIALAEGDIEGAFADLETLSKRPGDGSWRLIAQVLIGIEDKELAARLLGQLATPERLGNREMDWIAMSQLAFKLGDKPQSERLSAAAVARFKSGDAYGWSAQLALDRGDKAGARKQFAEALKRDPSSLRLRSGYAALLADGGDNAGAARVLAAGKQNDVTFGARAAYAARAEDKALLAALYREIEADPSERSGKRLFLLGQVAEILDKPVQALGWYSEVPEDDERWLDAGVRFIVLTDQQGDNAAALERLNELRIAAGTDSREAADLFLLEADLFTRKSRKAEAMKVYARGLDQLPDDPRLLYARAMLSIDLDDIAAGERDLRTIIAADPVNADALNALGYTLVDRTDRVVEANELIERAIKLKPDEPAIIDSYGWAQYRLGHLDEAVKQLRRAYELHPDAEIAAHLGEALWARGDRAEARRIWEQGRKKDADNKVLIETTRRLAS
jgi:tetratricopeptide (TPR) repeat protein